jgi:hypothetical protein
LKEALPLIGQSPGESAIRNSELGIGPPPHTP